MTDFYDSRAATWQRVFAYKNPARGREEQNPGPDGVQGAMSEAAGKISPRVTR